MSRTTAAFRVLVAEDDTEMRELIVDVLESDGYMVTQAVDGHELLARVAAFFGPPANDPNLDLIISDVCMPGPSGLSILAALSNCDRAPPVILITAFGSHELRCKALWLGAATFFDKPFDLEDLRAAVRHITSQRAYSVG